MNNIRNDSMKLISALFVLTFASLQLVASAGDSLDPKSAQTHMKIKIGSAAFNATLEENATAAAFETLLPMTVKMTELNGNEKYFRLGKDLPTKASSPGKIENGDLLIYGADTLVLFYKSFPTSYSYTRLGRIENPTGLAAAVGSGNVSVTFEATEKSSK